MDELVQLARDHIIEDHGGEDHEAFDLSEYELLIRSAARTVEG